MQVLKGNSGDYTLAITTSTLTGIPESANYVDGDYQLVISNVSSATIYFRFSLGTAPGSITGGVQIESNDVLVVNMASGTNGFVYQTSGSSKTINYSIKEIEEVK